MNPFYFYKKKIKFFKANDIYIYNFKKNFFWKLSSPFLIINKNLFFNRNLSTNSTIKILYGSQTGTAMGFAYDLGEDAEKKKIPVEVIDMEQYDQVIIIILYFLKNFF